MTWARREGERESDGGWGGYQHTLCERGNEAERAGNNVVAPLFRLPQVTAVGKVFIESYLIKYEDEEKHHITLKSSEDLKIAMRAFEQGGAHYIKLLVERAGEGRRGLFGRKKKVLTEVPENGGGGKGGGLFGRRGTGSVRGSDIDE